MERMDLDHVIARELGIHVESIDDALAYQSIPEWDSLRHVGLMLAIERLIGRRLCEDEVVSMKSVGTIRDFLSDAMSRKGPRRVARSDLPQPERSPPIHRGLEDVYIDRSEITFIDGGQGTLEYRGYSIHDLVEGSSFEETAYLLLNGELPTASELAAFTQELRSSRALPAQAVDLLRALAEARVHPMEAVRTGVSALGALDSTGPGEPLSQMRAAGLRLVAQVPMLIAVYHALRSGRSPVLPDPELGHVESFVHMLVGSRPSVDTVRILNKVLIVHADHGVNASTFAARVAIGCEASLHAAITAAIAAFSGSLHGGAAERVIELIDAVGHPENAAAYVRERRSARLPVMGFGHRVYRVEDPRVRHLRAAAHSLAAANGDTTGLEIAQAVVKEMEPYARHGIGPNVDLFAGLVYRQLGLSDDLAVPMFVAARIAGWVTHAIEQKASNVLIRPRLHYVGQRSRTYRATTER